MEQAKKKRLRSRRNLVDSLSAAADNATFELSVAQLSDRKNEAMGEYGRFGSELCHVNNAVELLEPSSTFC